jgi:hypothetical protein
VYAFSAEGSDRAGFFPSAKRSRICAVAQGLRTFLEGRQETTAFPPVSASTTVMLTTAPQMPAARRTATRGRPDTEPHHPYGHGRTKDRVRYHPSGCPFLEQTSGPVSRISRTCSSSAHHRPHWTENEDRPPNLFTRFSGRFVYCV